MTVAVKRFSSKTWNGFDTDLNRDGPSMSTDLVFISYSHRDKEWRKDLEIHLKPYLREGSITSWSDEQIVAGSQWLGEIKSALAQTKIAVLLVTPDFIASDFIHEHELGPLLKEAKQGGVKILWVPVRASAYKKTALKDYQAVRDPDKPLANMMEADRDPAWVSICEEIEKQLTAKRLAEAQKEVDFARLLEQAAKAEAKKDWRTALDKLKEALILKKAAGLAERRLTLRARGKWPRLIIPVRSLVFKRF
jgi:hypothetical protein